MAAALGKGQRSTFQRGSFCVSDAERTPSIFFEFRNFLEKVWVRFFEAALAEYEIEALFTSEIESLSNGYGPTPLFRMHAIPE
jgi:hypothetical protein